ncbi:hypothetical protein [Niabella ginsenosidivorans]|nr:hypothetical protein [Niabella ginsenosidivorans]
MKRMIIIACALLLFTAGLSATPVAPENHNNYRVTETGPRSNPYTVIRLYTKEDKQFPEIAMTGYRLKTQKPAIVKRLNILAIPFMQATQPVLRRCRALKPARFLPLKPSPNRAL